MHFLVLEFFEEVFPVGSSKSFEMAKKIAIFAAKWINIR